MGKKVIKGVSINSNDRAAINDNFTELYSNLGLVGVTASAAEVNYNDITTLGTGAASKAVVLDAGEDYTWPAAGILTYGVLKDSAGTTLSATAAEINQACDQSAQAMACAAGFLGTGTIYKAGVTKVGDVFKTSIIIDLTGAQSKDTDLDIIGNSGVSYIAQVTAALNGTTILMGSMTCLEVPVGGAVDIDLYRATAGTGAYDAAVTGLAGQAAVITAGGNWTLALTKAFGSIPAANDYLYLTSGAAVAGVYSAGKFLIELWGY